MSDTTKTAARMTVWVEVTLRVQVRADATDDEVEHAVMERLDAASYDHGVLRDTLNCSVRRTA